MTRDKIPSNAEAGFTASAERNKFRSDTLRNILTAAMIVAGGFWALFEYTALLRKERAVVEIQLDSLKSDQIRASLLPKLVLDIRERFFVEKDDKIWLAATVHISNEGLKGTTLDISLEPFRIAKVESVDQSGKIIAGPIRFVGKLKLRSSEEASDGKGQTANITHISIQSGRSTQIPFLIDLEERGVYYVEFRSKMTEKSKDEWQEIGAPIGKTLNWAVSKYISTETVVDESDHAASK